MDPIFGSLISAAGNVAGGILGQQSANARNNQMLNAQGLSDLYALQWRAGDARAAEKATGINALTLLGAPTNAGVPNLVGDNSLGGGIAAAGQDIGRAVAAKASQNDRQSELEMKLLEAKIANVNSDTVRQQAEASRISRSLGSAGTPPSFPYNPMLGGPVDPRAHKGMIPITQSAYDPRTGEVYSIPSEKAASPLQTLGALPVNIGVAGRSFGEMMDLSWGRGIGSIVPSGAAWRGVDNSQYAPF